MKKEIIKWILAKRAKMNRMENKDLLNMSEEQLLDEYDEISEDLQSKEK